jgi:hypothetical protein
VPLNTCYPTSRASRATPCSGPCVAEHALAVYRRIVPLYVPCYRFVLDRYLPRSVLVAYIFHSPGLGPASKYSRSFPRFAFACPPPLASSFTPFTIRNCAVGATRAQHGLHRYVSPRIPSRIHTHSLSPSLSGSGDNNPRTSPLVRPRAHSHLGDVAWLFIFYSFPNSRADSTSAIQWKLTSYTSHVTVIPIGIAKKRAGARSRCSAGHGTTNVCVYCRRRAVPR